MQLITSISRSVRMLMCVVLVVACSSGSNDAGKQAPTPQQYDLNHPVIIKLPDKLNEISGLAYYPKDSSLFAIIDEAGILYKIMLQKGKPQIQQWRFAKHSDFEDLVLLDSVFYILKSKGEIDAVKFVTTDSVQAQNYKMPIEGKNEFEIIYYDPSIKQLVLICKDCAADDKTVTSTWTFDPVTRSFSKGPYAIDATTIKAMDADERKTRFKPSAAAIHPITGELYIVSSVNKVLVIADARGKVKQVYALDPDVYKQPEGIAFTPSGDMFISNEAAGQGLPNLLYFKYKK